MMRFILKVPDSADCSLDVQRHLSRELCHQQLIKQQSHGCLIPKTIVPKLCPKMLLRIQRHRVLFYTF